MNLAPTRGHCRLGTYGCNGSCAVKGCLIDKYAFLKKVVRRLRRLDVNVGGCRGTHGCRIDLRVMLLLVIQGDQVQLVEGRLGRRSRGRQRRKRIAVLNMRCERLLPAGTGSSGDAAARLNARRGS